MAIVEALKRTVRRLLQKRQDETNASTAESRTANSPPYRRSVRNTKVSATATCDLSFGILIVTREASAIVKTERKIRKTSTRSTGKRSSAISKALIPST